jgi:hypothetical protein
VFQAQGGLPVLDWTKVSTNGQQSYYAYGGFTFDISEGCVGVVPPPAGGAAPQPEWRAVLARPNDGRPGLHVQEQDTATVNPL